MAIIMKKHGKQIISLTLCLVLLFLAAACGADKGNMPEDGGSAGSEIILTDQAGNEVKLDAPAERIVSCYYITTYACISLGLTDKLVGIESKADKRPVYKMAAPEILELPDVGTLKEFNVEAAAAVEPDLVIMPKRLSDSAKALKELLSVRLAARRKRRKAFCNITTRRKKNWPATGRREQERRCIWPAFLPI